MLAGYAEIHTMPDGRMLCWQAVHEDVLEARRIVQRSVELYMKRDRRRKIKTQAALSPARREEA